MFFRYLEEAFNIQPAAARLVREAEAGLAAEFNEADETAAYNQLKVLAAMRKNRLSDAHFSRTGGYGYNDAGREVTEAVYADVFKTEAALVRPQLISGTHALTAAMFGNLRPGDGLYSPAGKPYDTLESVIGIREASGSLAEYGITYSQTELTPDGAFDYERIAKAVTPRVKLAAIQRSKGYAWRGSFTVAAINELILFIKKINPRIICMVDNCYGEFTETEEPEADLIVGSLNKNPGGGLAPSGGYIAGKKKYVEAAAERLTAPGLGSEVGPMLGFTREIIQGLFISPQLVGGCVKGARLAAAVFDKLGFDVLPAPAGARTDIVQAIRLNTAEGVAAFCEGIQRAAPVDAFVKPVPGHMPGYGAPVIMAAGTFIQGASAELSADAPLAPPYIVYFQGGLTFAHARAGVAFALDSMLRHGIINVKIN